MIRRLTLLLIVSALLSLVPVAGASAEDGYYTWTSGDLPLTVVVAPAPVAVP